MRQPIQVLKNSYNAFASRETINQIRQKWQARFTFILLFAVALFATNAPTLKAAGSHLDFSFSGNGRVITDFGSEAASLAVAVQADGKIVVAGYAEVSGSDRDFALARYNANGSLDTTFNGDGKVRTDFAGGLDEARALVIQPDGKIIAVGYAVVSSVYNFAVVRYNTNGSLDTTFSGNGKNYFSFSGANNVAQGVALQDDGKIVVVGFGPYWAVARLNANGTLDSTFGTGGKITTDFGDVSGAVGVVVQSNGKIVVGGSGRAGLVTFTDFALARYNANGSLDSTFGNAGIVMTDMNGGQDDIAVGLKLLPGGRLVLAGSSNPASSNRTMDVARYQTDGSLDPTFGIGGRVVIPGEEGEGMEVGPNNEIIVVDADRFGMHRFLGSGALDSRFGTGGRVSTSFLGALNLGRSHSVALQSDGKIVLAGSVYINDDRNEPAVARYNPISTAANSDFSQDGRADFAVFRPSNGVWYISNSVTGANTIFSWGVSGDIPAPGDYDRDGKTDAAVFRPSTGVWYIIRSSDGGFIITQFGLNGDKPVAGDYDGDGLTDIAVYRPSSGVWYLQQSTLGFTAFQFGLSADNPTPADYDGDGLTDVAVFRPSDGVWYLQRSALGFTALNFGLNGDRPTPGDYDADGKADVSVWRPSSGVWYVYRSSYNSASNSATAFNWGLSGDIPAPADFDGDGKTDYVVFRPSSGIWYVLKSATNAFSALNWGINGDVPIGSAVP